jgi:hypothetical protein
MTVESLRDEPKNSIKELLSLELNKARQIGFVTYCLAGNRDVPPEIETDYKRFHRGRYSLEGLRESFEKGAIFIGVEASESMRGRSRAPDSVLDNYHHFLKEYSREMEKAKEPLKSTPKAIIKNYPQFLDDHLFDNYWPDVFAIAFLRGGDNKSFWQYLQTHLRATIFGFAQAADWFGDKKLASESMKLLKEFNNPMRTDPLMIAGLVDLKSSGYPRPTV